MPEKNLTEIPKDLRDLYQKGSVALQRQNFDYAIAIFNRGLAEQNLGRTADAARDFARARQTGPRLTPQKE